MHFIFSVPSEHSILITFMQCWTNFEVKGPTADVVGPLNVIHMFCVYWVVTIDFISSLKELRHRFQSFIVFFVYSDLTNNNVGLREIIICK